jgi:hypothetical protein
MPPAPARKDRPTLGGFESVVGAFGFGGRNNARSPNGYQQDAEGDSAAPAVRAASPRDWPVSGQGVQLQQEDDRTDRRGQGQWDDLPQPGCLSSDQSL